jgi:acetyl-CoA carboxylase carboxyltransferase component
VAHTIATCRLVIEYYYQGTHFTFLCSQRGIPMVFLHNTHEEDITDTTSIKQKSTMISAVASCKVGVRPHQCSTWLMLMIAFCQIPKISIVVGRSFGTSSYAMVGTHLSASIHDTHTHDHTFYPSV